MGVDQVNLKQMKAHLEFEQARDKELHDQAVAAGDMHGELGRKFNNFDKKYKEDLSIYEEARKESEAIAYETIGNLLSNQEAQKAESKKPAEPAPAPVNVAPTTVTTVVEPKKSAKTVFPKVKYDTDGKDKTIKIKSGDSLAKIASEKYGEVTPALISALAQKNKFDDPHMIKAGKDLICPETIKIGDHTYKIKAETPAAPAPAPAPVVAETAAVPVPAPTPAPAETAAVPVPAPTPAPAEPPKAVEPAPTTAPAEPPKAVEPAPEAAETPAPVVAETAAVPVPAPTPAPAEPPKAVEPAPEAAETPAPAAKNFLPLGESLSKSFGSLSRQLSSTVEVLANKLPPVSDVVAAPQVAEDRVKAEEKAKVEAEKQAKLEANAQEIIDEQAKEDQCLDEQASLKAEEDAKLQTKQLEAEEDDKAESEAKASLEDCNNEQVLVEANAKAEAAQAETAKVEQLVKDQKEQEQRDANLQQSNKDFLYKADGLKAPASAAAAAAKVAAASVAEKAPETSTPKAEASKTEAKPEKPAPAPAKSKEVELEVIEGTSLLDGRSFKRTYRGDKMINETVLKADKKTPDYITYLDDNQQKISQKAYHDDGSFTFYVFNKKGEITNTTDYNKDGRQTLFSRLFDN